MTDTMDLDALFREARTALRGQKAEIIKRKEKAKQDPLDAPPDTAGIYRNPANWIKGQGIALIHEHSGVLLGHFTEYRHRTVLDARRLVREESPSELESVEYISLDIALKNGELPKRRAWETVLKLTTNLSIVSLGAFAVAVPLLAHFGTGRIVRLELEHPTAFRIPGGALQLPAGVDLLEVIAPATLNDILTKLDQPLCQ